MGNMMCCEQNNNKHPQRKDKTSKDVINPQKQIQPTYYTNPATKDEDFTFNDKIKMQSIMNKYEVNYVPNFNDTTSETSWYGVAQTLIEDINRINTDPEWASGSAKNGLELIYSQKDEKIFLGSKQMPTKQLSSAIININGTTPNGFGGYDTHTTVNESFRNSSANGQNSFQNGPQLVSNPDITRNKSGGQARQSVGLNSNMVVNVVKLEFEVSCSAEKMLKGLQNLKKFTNKIQKQTIIESSGNKEFCISHILFSKQMQKIQRDLVIANYYTDIGPNLNNCYASVNHHKIAELPDVVRTLIIKGGHTFLEQYDTATQEQLTSSHRPAPNNQANNNNNNSNNRKSSQVNGEEPTSTNAFGSMNLNIGQVKTKVRFYGEFFCKNIYDESMVRMVFLTEFREYIAICKSIALNESLASSEYEGESLDKDPEQIDMENTVDEK